MPELPEVEAARRALQDHCCGKRIAKAIIADDSKVIEGVSPSELQKALVGKKIIRALRKGKNMWLELDSPPFPSFQFGMTGAVHIKGVSVTKYKRSAVNDNDEWPSKFSKVFMELDDGVEMSFTDKRRFARVRLLENPEASPPISELGPDALLELMPEDDFIVALSKKKTAVKGILLDQSFIAGIGNWVADEVLYHANIHPMQLASTLSKENCKSLHKCIKEVIEKALEVGADSSQYPENWIFHSREKKPGKAFVDGKKIDFITVGGRTSAYVPDLQKFDGPVAVEGGNKSRKKKDTFKAESSESEKEVGEEEEIEEVKGKRNQGKRGGRSAKSAKAGMTGVIASEGKGKRKSLKTAEEEKPRKIGGSKKLNELEASEQAAAVEAEKTQGKLEVEKEEESEKAKDKQSRGKRGGRPANTTKIETTAVITGKERGKEKTSATVGEEEKTRKRGGRKRPNGIEASEQFDAKAAEEELVQKRGKMNHKMEVTDQEEVEKMTPQAKKIGRQPHKGLEKNSNEESGSKKDPGETSDAVNGETKGEEALPDQIKNPDASTNTSEKPSQGRKRKRGGKSH